MKFLRAAAFAMLLLCSGCAEEAPPAPVDGAPHLFQGSSAPMAHGGGTWKVWNLFVVDGRGRLDLLGQSTKPRSQDDSDPGRFTPPRANRRGGGFDLIVQFQH